MTTKRKYSLRKFKIGVASVLVGIGVATTGAAVAHAGDESTTPKTETTQPAVPKVIQDAQADADKADAKVKELEGKVADKTTEATAANTKLETEKKEATDAETAKTEAEKTKKDAEAAKTTADSELADAKAKAADADAKAKEEAKKEEDAKKEEADAKEALKEAFANLEKEIDANANIKDKEAAKKLLGKEDLLAAVEAGDLKAGDLLKEFADDNEKAEANKEVEKKLRNKDQAKKADAGATAGKEGKTDALPEDLKAKIDEAEKADAARPQSEKLQDKADQLEDQLDSVEKQYDEAKKVSDEKAAVLEKQEKALKEAKEAADIAEKYKLKDDIVNPLKNVVKEIEKTHDEAKAEFDKANEVTVDYAEQGKELEKEYNDTVAAVKAAKEEEAKNPKPTEKPVEKPKVKTEAEKAAEAKVEADKKVAEAQAKVTAAEAKVNETTKALEEATTKATKEEADVQPATDAKTAADKAKSDAEAELAKAKEEAEKAKQKVEELKKEEADNLEALKGALDQLEKDAEAKIDANDKIEDKDKAKEEAKAAIGKDAILKAIENGDISATEAAKELEDDSNKAEANKDVENKLRDKNQVQDAKPSTTAPDKKLTDEEAKKIEEINKADKEKARPESEKLQELADYLYNEIDRLTEIADKDKAAAEALLEKFNHAKEVLLEARQALRAAEEANSNPEVLKALKKVVYNLRLDRDTVKSELVKYTVPLEDYTKQINKLTDEYNQTLKDLEAAKAKEVSTEKLDTPTTKETLEKEKAEADKADKEYEKLLAEKQSEAEKKLNDLKEEIKDLEAELAKDKDNEDVSDKLNAMRSALARAEKDLKENPDALVYAVLLPKVDALPTASQALKAEINKLKEEKEKTTDDSQKAELEKKIAEKEALLAEVEKAESNETPAPNKPAEETPAPNKPAEETPAPAPADKPQHSNGQDAPVNYVPELGNVDKLQLEAKINKLKEELKTADPVKAEKLKEELAEKEEALRILSAQLAPVLELPELDIKAVEDEIKKVEEQLKTADPAKVKELEKLLADHKELLEELKVLAANLPAVNEVPEFDLSTLNTPTGDGNSFGPKQEAKAAAKEEGKVLPNTGMNTSNTTALGLSLIGLIGLAVRRKLSK